MKRRTRFRGDLQVDGDIVGSDGQPIDFGGGGSVDWSQPIPELHFAGDPDDDTSGISLAWDEDFFGLAAKGQPGTGYAQLLAVNPDDATEYAYLDSGGFGGNNSQGTVALYPGSLAIGHPYSPGPLFEWSQQYGLQMNGGVSGDSSMFITPDDGLGLGFVGLALLLANAQAVLDPDVLYFAKMDGGLGLSAKPEFSMKLDGTMHWGDGGAVETDTRLTRNAPGTLEIDHILSFKGDPSDNTSGVTLAWDQGLYGLALRGRPGSFDGELYTIDSDVDDRYGNLYPGGLQVHNGVAAGGGFAYLTPQQMRISNDDGHIAILAPDELILDTPGAFIQALSPDGTAYKLTPPNGGGPAEWVAA